MTSLCKSVPRAVQQVAVSPILRTSILDDFCIRPCVSRGSAQRFRRTDSNARSNGKSPILWIYDHAPTRWVIIGVFVVAWFLAIVFLFSDIVQVLAARPWWEDLIVAMAAVAVPLSLNCAVLVRRTGYGTRPTKNGVRLTEQNTQLSAELDAERNRLVTNRDKVGFVLFGVEGN